MSARDEFAPASSDGYCSEAVWGPMCAEIDRLRGEVAKLRGLLAEYICTGAGDCRARSHIEGCFADDYRNMRTRER